MDTNALLTIAFSIIANFTNAVHVPPDSVPQSTNDLAAFSVGRRFFPLDMYLRHKRGTEFWIRGGAVKLYHTPRMYFGLQDPRLIPQFIGEARISSNEVVQLATSAVRKLIKSGDPLSDIVPEVHMAKPYKGETVPFYDVTWREPGAQAFYVARVQVDAGKGLIASLQTSGNGFSDVSSVQRISNVVYSADSARSISGREPTPAAAPDRKE